ncbi:hypothetical protein CCP2SC5_1930001 [Azospirillaceae bacterium]
MYSYIWDILRENALAGHNMFLSQIDPEVRN